MTVLKFATQDAALADEHGLSYNVRANEPWDADDPLVKRHPSFFSDSPLRVGHTVPNDADMAERESLGGPAVEAATHAPGETRKAVGAR